jgi:outer membrane receptor for ferrienterochelin and colicins
MDEKKNTYRELTNDANPFLETRWRDYFLFLFSIFFLGLLTAIPFAAGAEGKEELPDVAAIGIEELMALRITSVYGASRYLQKISEAPSRVTILTSRDIQHYGWKTLAELLNSVPGFYVTYDRNYHYVGVRGFGRPADYNSRILLLVDGHKLNDNIYFQAPIGTDFPVDLDLIDWVEVIQGPSSSIYGASAFFGVVNITTKKGMDLKGVEVSGAAGSFETYGGRLSYGYQNEAKQTDILLSGSFMESQGQRNLYFREFDDPATNNGRVPNRDQDQSRSLFTKATWKELTLAGAYQYRWKAIPTASFGTVFNSPDTNTGDERAYLDLRFEKPLSGDWDVLARISYDYYSYYGHYLYDYPPRTLNKDYAYGQWAGTEIKVTKKIWDNLKFTVGTEYTLNFQEDSGNYDLDPYTRYLDDRRNSSVWGAFVQGEYYLTPRLILNAGVRHDYYSTFGGTTNPRAAIIFNPTDQTNLKLLYGKAFRPPIDFELYYLSDTQKGNPGLKPETIQTYEVVVEQFLSRTLRGLCSIYYYNIDNLISQKAGPDDKINTFENAKPIEAKGIELELNGRWPSGWEGRVSYTYQETQLQESGAELSNSPRHMIKFNLTAPIIKRKLLAGFEERYLSPRKTISGNDTEAVWVTNLTLFAPRIWKNLDFSVSVYNLFDYTYGDPVSVDFRQDQIPQDGRSFRIKLTYKF